MSDQELQVKKKSTAERVFNFIILGLAAFLVIMILILVFTTAPAKNEYINSAASIITSLDNGRYSDAVSYVYYNRSCGVTEETDEDYAECYAAVDYIVAESYYVAYSEAGDRETAAKYSDDMDTALAKMGDLEFLADEIDEVFER